MTDSACFAIEIPRLEAALQAIGAPAPRVVEQVDLGRLLPTVWQTLGAAAWTVKDLRDRGLIATVEARPTGLALRQAAGCRVAGFEVVRVGETRRWRIWSLRP